MSFLTPTRPNGVQLSFITPAPSIGGQQSFITPAPSKGGQQSFIPPAPSKGGQWSFLTPTCPEGVQWRFIAPSCPSGNQWCSITPENAGPLLHSPNLGVLNPSSAHLALGMMTISLCSCPRASIGQRFLQRLNELCVQLNCVSTGCTLKQLNSLIRRGVWMLLDLECMIPYV